MAQSILPNLKEGVESIRVIRGGIQARLSRLNSGSTSKVQDGDLVVGALIEGVDVLHKEMRAVEGSKFVPENVLRPTAEDMN